jgi:hypothetical protein
MHVSSQKWKWTHRIVAFGSAVAVLGSVVSLDGAALAKGPGSGGGTSSVPTVTGVAPSTGPAAGGTSVTISGTNLVDPTGASKTVVKFGTNTADPASVRCTATSCTVTSPPGMDRTDVFVTVGSQTSARDSKDRFTYIPKLTSITPSNGPAAGGTSVKIVGEGLAPGATTLAFGATAVTAVVSCAVDGKSCTTTTPSGASGSTANVVATVGGQVSNAIPFGFDAAATPNAVLALSATTLNFPDTPTGQTGAALPLTLSSNGTAPVTIQAIAITGDFAQTNTCSNATPPALPRDLAPGTSCTVNVAFTPTQSGSRTGTLTITDGTGKTYPVSLGGIGAAGQVSLTPASLDFGAINTAGPASAPQTATLRNSGTAPLTVSNIAVTGTAAAFYTRTTPAPANNCPTTFPATLPAGASCVVSLTFFPTSTGQQPASLQVTDSGAGSPHTVALQGSGTVDGTPVIDSITPNSGLATGGETVVIAGRNFSATSGSTQISIGSNAATGVACTTTQCSLKTPAGQIGQQPISLKVSGQVASNPTNVQFTYLPVSNPDGTLTVGPIDPATGLPAWFRDSAGRHLDLCIEQTASKCLTTPPDPKQPVSFPGNFPDEAFYWNATAIMPAGDAGANARLVLATESLVTAGVPSVFTRVRLTASGLTAGAHYTLTYPFGAKDLIAGADGTIKDTIDINAALSGGTTIKSDVGPFLTDPTAPAGYIGDPAVNRTLTGSPIGKNIFALDGPNAGGNGVNHAQTDQFALQGRLAVPKASVKGGVFTSPQSVTLKATDPTATVRYTTDGSIPNAASLVASPNTPIALSATTTLKFLEQYADGGVSPVVTEQYTFDSARGAPTITALSPNTGPAFGGTRVDITGSNFSTLAGGTTIKFGSDVVTSQNVSCDTDTHCTAVSPGGPVGAVDVTATVASQTSPVSATDASTKFTYTEVDNKGSVTPGPIDPVNGYPSEYRDSRGLRLELCLDAGGFCLAVPGEVPDPSKPVSFPFNFPAESFWWNATVDMPGIGPGGTGRGLLVLGTEAAFTGEEAIPGQQINFNRIRIRISNLVAGQHYTITHPYGVEDLVAERQADGTGRINVTTDIGCVTPPCAFNTPLGLNPTGPSVGPWLRWDSGAPEGFVGDGVSEHTVTGSPIGQNVFRIEGPNAGGAGVNSIETNLFTLQGKIAGPKVAADKPGAHYSSPLDVKLTATDAAGETSQIWYTLDGSTPRTDGSSLTYDASKAVHIDLGNTTLKFIGKNQSGGLSPVYAESYVIGSTPTASPAGGAYNTAQTVTLKPSDSKSSVYYTLDGSDPRPNVGTTLLYSAPLSLTSTTTLKFVEAFADGTLSPIVTEAYNLDAVAPAVITDSPVPGYYHTVQQVSFRANKVADVWYTSTTDGSTPPDPLGADGKLTGTKFTGTPITVGVNTTFALRAVDPSGNVSDLTSAVYRVNTANVAVGPMDNATGFPSFYTDNNNLSLQLCVDASGACLTTVADPTLPPSVPDNFIDEAFWWNATATMNAGNGGRATLVLATEAAFATGDNIVQGQQTAFNRIRSKVTNLTPGATYTITHPYGKDTATADSGGTIFITEDIGCLDAGTGCLASTVLGGRVGPWLTWDAGAPDGYVGDGATPHLVTGSPNGTNFFLLEGPNAGGQGIDRAETNLFVVAGKLSSTVTPPVQPTIPAAPSGLIATASNARVDLTWTASTGAKSYTVNRSTTAGSGYQPIATGVTGLSFSDTTATNGTPYFYVVTAVNAAGESGASNEATATPAAPVTAPAVSFSPTSLAFGQTKGGQKVGTTSTPLLTTLTNTGTGTLNISKIALGGASPATFAISSMSCGSTLAPGASCSIGVTFTPRAKGNVTATLDLTDQLGTQTVALTGKGN